MSSTAELTIEDLNDVLNCLWKARDKWHFIGAALGIDDTTLNVIEMDHQGKVDRCYSDMISRVLKSGNITWDDVARKLQSPTVGVNVQLKHGGMF